MGNWEKVYKVRGRPLITVDKPGSEIEAVLAEIQRKALIEIEGSDGGGTGTAVAVSITCERLDENTIQIKGSVKVPDAGGRGDGQTIGEEKRSDGATGLYVVGRDSAEPLQVFQKKLNGEFGFDVVRAT